MDKFVNNTPKVVYQKESIDYDKLADAIVKAEKQIRQENKIVYEEKQEEKEDIENIKIYPPIIIVNTLTNCSKTCEAP